MNLELKTDQDVQQIVASQIQAVETSLPTASDLSTASESSHKSVDSAEDNSTVIVPMNLPMDVSHEGSNFEVCPDASISSMAHGDKIEALAAYADKFPTEPKAIQNLIVYANNLSDTSLLNTKMKKDLIENIQKATMNSTARASSKGYQGLKGNKASKQFLTDTLAPFKPVTKEISQAEVVHQTLRAISGQLILAGSDQSHPTMVEMDAQNNKALTGSSAPNSLGSHKSPAPAPAQPSSTPSNGSALPRPILPPSGVTPLPPFDFPQGSSIGLKGVKDYYVKLMEYMHAHPNDITAMQDMMDFLVKISNFYKGNIPSDIQTLLDGGSSGTSGAIDAIHSMIPRLAQYAFFAGYTTQTFNGKDAMIGYLDDMVDSLKQDAGTKYTQAITNVVQHQLANVDIFASDHTDASGRLFYVQTLPNTVSIPGTRGYITKYYWDNKDAAGQDLPAGTMTSQYYITQIINNQNPDGTSAPDKFNVGLNDDINEIQTNYRTSALTDLLAQYKDPLTAITLWIMQVYDNQYQSQESGLNETTDDLTNMTNEIATRLSTLAQNIGFTGYDPKTGIPSGQKMSATDAEEFAQTLSNGSTLMDSMFQFNGISDTWDKNVFQDICSITLTNPSTFPASGKPAYPQDHFPATVGQLLYGNAPDTGQPYTADEKATYLCTMNLAPPPVPTTPPSGTPYPMAPSLSQGYQQTVGDLQQAGGLITGRSKTVSLQLQQVSDCDSQDIKAWSTMLQDLAQFILKGPIAAQKQN